MTELSHPGNPLHFHYPLAVLSIVGPAAETIKSHLLASSHTKSIFLTRLQSCTTWRHPASSCVKLMAATGESLIAQDILSYLLEHTAAEDTIEGIVEWWLLEEKIKRRTKEVQKILDELARDSLIIELKSKDSKIRYRLNKRKTNEIRAILKAEGKRD